MNENTRVAIKVEYESDGIYKVCLGEIEENKLEKLRELMNFDAGEENFMWMENDGLVFWKDKVSIISIKELEEKSSIFERPQIKGSTNSNTNTGICS